MLSERLQELEAEGIVDRTVVPEAPIRVEYALTKKGKELAKAIEAITAWAHDWIELDPKPAAIDPSRRPSDRRATRGERAARTRRPPRSQAAR
jgi:DNA-binding HxlR family transcriptional regulator